MAKVKQLGHLVLRANEIDVSENFYTSILGLHVTTRRPVSYTHLTLPTKA